jgi:hypothetical protein
MYEFVVHMKHCKKDIVYNLYVCSVTQHRQTHRHRHRHTHTHTHNDNVLIRIKWNSNVTVLFSLTICKSFPVLEFWQKGALLSTELTSMV